MNPDLKGTILLAEDDENDVILLRMAMERAGITLPLVVASDGGQVVKLLSESGADGGPPRLVLLDLKMPCMDGFDVLEWLRKHRHLENVPVVVFSSSAVQRDIEKAMALGAHDYITKPSSPRLLTALLRDLRARYL